MKWLIFSEHEIANGCKSASEDSAPEPKLHSEQNQYSKMRRSKNFEKNSKDTRIQKSSGSTGYSSTSGDEDNETPCEMVELDDNELVFMTEQLNR